jgi:hypothetical protein
MLAAAVLSTVLVGSPAMAQTAPPPECGAEWTKVPSPSPGTIYSVLLDVAAIGTGDGWAVGFRAYFDSDEQYAVSPIIERWDGTEWTVDYRPGFAGQLAGVFALSTDDVWAVGHTGLESIDFEPLIMHWDGASWTRVDSPDAEMGYLTALGGSGSDDLWAAGVKIGTYETIIEHWDGASWTLVEHPSPSSDYVALSGLAASGSDDVSIVGTYLDDEARNAPLALHWNGTKWRRTHPVSSAEGGTSLLDVTINSSGRVWAVGSAVDGSGATQAVAQRWTHRGWTSAMPPARPGSSSLASVTTGPDGIWAVGSQTAPDATPTTLIERWRPRDHEWRVVASPNASGDNYLLAVDQTPEGELWAVGFHRTPSEEKTLAVHRCG